MLNLYKSHGELKGEKYISVSIMHVPAGVAVYEGGKWKATFLEKEDAQDFAQKRAKAPWRVYVEEE